MAKAKVKKVIDMDLFCSARKALDKEKNKTVLPLSPSLDLRLGGGILEGSFVLIQGREKAGKTLTCMEAAVNALKQGRWVIYLDTECRMTASKYFIIDGFDLLSHPKFLLLNSESSTDGVVLGGEKMYSMIIKMMKLEKYKGALYIIDSISNIITQDCLDDEEVTSQRRDAAPRLNSDFCKKVAPFIRTSNSILMGVQHLQASQNPALHGALEPIGGTRLLYSADIVLLCKHKPLNIDGENVGSGFEKGGDAIDGLLIRYDIPYNKLLGPYVAKDKDEKVHNYYRFGKGCWRSREIFDVLNYMGLVSYGKSGWVTFMTEKITDKVQGTDKAADIIQENIEYFEKIIKDYYVNTFGINYEFAPPKEEDDE